MKKYSVKQIINNVSNRVPFWMPWGFLKWSGRLCSFVLLLLLFIALFCIPDCSSSSGNNGLTPINLNDPAIGNMPILFNPDNERGPLVPISGGNGSGLPWPKMIPDGERHPALPAPGDNRIPKTDPNKIITDQNTGRQVDAAHLLVVLNSDDGDSTFNKFAAGVSELYPPQECSIEYYNTLTKIVILSVNPANRMTIKEELPSKIPDVDFYVVEIEVLAEGANRPDDPAFNHEDLSWHFSPIKAYEAWELTRGNPSVKVAVVDSYFELNHPDLSHVKVENPISLENGTEDVYPPASAETVPRIHGTHVAGIIFGEMGNKEGSSGIAPQCTFIPVSIGQLPNTASMVEGLLYAIYQGADVINMSLGTYIDPRLGRRLSIEKQIEIAEVLNVDKEYLWNYIFELSDQRNATIVWASGNNDVLSTMDESKRGTNTIIVDALNRKLDKADFSNFGNVPQYGQNHSTISAPGEQIVSTIPYGDYYPLDGTSMAAPIVTGAVALMKSLCPNLSNEEVISILKETAQPVDDESIGDLLQIRPALDKVKDEMLRFEDVLSNPESIVGTWQATTRLSVVDTDEEIELYMTFDSVSSGRKEIRFVVGERAGESCFSNLRLDISPSSISIEDISKPVSEQGSSFVLSKYTCQPDESGLLRVENAQDGVEENVYFNLKKIN